MKISIVMSFPFPDGKATANRIKVFAEKFTENSRVDCVEIFCTSQKKSSSYIYDDFIRVTSIKTNPLNKNMFFRRAIQELLIAFKLFREMKKSKSDLTIITIPSIFLLAPLVLNPNRNNFVIDVRDTTWTYLGNSFLSRATRKLMSMLFLLASKRSKIISVTNVAEHDEIKTLTGRSSIIVANGISENRLSEMQSIRPPIHRKYKTIAYIGNVGIGQEIDKLVYFARKIPNLKIKIIGDGAKLEDLKQKCISDNINNVIFTGFISQNKIAKYIESADILFAQIGQNYQTAVPTKVFEYIASGRKVLLGLPKGPARDIFSKFHGVEIFDVGDYVRFKESYKKLLSTDLSSEKKQINLDLLRKYHLREENAKVLVDSIMTLDIAKYL